MSELHDTLTLSRLEGDATTWHGNSYDMLARTGPRVTLTLDRNTWEAMGRPVDLDMELTGTTEGNAEPTFAILAEVGMERMAQVEEHGYTPKHDDTHRVWEMVSLATGYLDAADPLGHLEPTRENAVKAAAVIVALIERMDREAAAQPQGSTVMDGVTLDPDRPEPPFPGGTA